MLNPTMAHACAMSHASPFFPFTERIRSPFWMDFLVDPLRGSVQGLCIGPRSMSGFRRRLAVVSNGYILYLCSYIGIWYLYRHKSKYLQCLQRYLPLLKTGLERSKFSWCSMCGLVDTPQLCWSDSSWWPWNANTISSQSSVETSLRGNVSEVYIKLHKSIWINDIVNNHT